MTYPGRRSYDEGCIAAHALDLVGDRWALLVVRELMLGPRRFSDLRAGLPGVSANVLARRLEEMEAAGIVIPAARGYALTPAGEGLWPVIRALAAWGARQPGHDPARFISPTALMLSMRVTCARARAGTHLVEMRAGEEIFTIATAPGSYGVTRGPGRTAPAGLVFAGGTNALAAAVYGAQPLAEVAAAGMIAFRGDAAEGQGFLDLFALPPPQPAGST